MVAVVVYFTAFYRKPDGTENLSFSRSLGLAEKNALREAIVKMLYDVREKWGNEQSKMNLNPETSYQFLNEMSSEELLTIEAFIDVFKDTFERKSGDLSNRQKAIFDKAITILNSYQIPSNNGLQLLTGT